MELKYYHFFILVLFLSCADVDDQPEPKVFDKKSNEVILTKRITPIDKKHKAFTDLVFFDDKWFLTYRESDKHIFGENGIVRIISSSNADDWDLAKIYKSDGFDLRDPKFSINNKKLMLITHGTKYKMQNVSDPSEFKDFRADYNSDLGWESFKDIYLDNNSNSIDAKIKGNQTYPWRITWYKNRAYSFGYNFQQNIFTFYLSDDGFNFTHINSISPIEGYPSEATIRVNNDGLFYTIVRREYKTALLGISKDLGATWKWIDTIPINQFGGPNFIFYKDGILLSGRENNKLILGYYDLNVKKYKKIMTFESGGDCSYPGMFQKDDFLWISYYSSHEQATGSSIYLSRINLNKLEL
ncbi:MULTISPECIES: sialidase family protein [Flavobacterium]|uniref:Exo-alpha-sialidase n=1 Tax=Flavobacterium endoglycinae TaxID=2816357 RepID=A0ABX7Q8W1_9FLAO|nr:MULTISPECIES: sialidase family protein [Flavobacterium]QSW87454.1 exo-alpha-sialidase [Flavobacterium endoglycinae]